MTAPSDQTSDQLRAGLTQVMESCPVDRCNPQDCPLFHLREMEREARVRWFNALHESDLQYLAAYHFVCMNLRLRAGADKPPASS
ncbi:MAG: hypothetical protein MUE94_02115 [Verrucomicrobia bacterium]|jgi:hypothetical protein|nr:hypothetical protein [Verrucomicrobiota bacterium]